MTRFTTPYGFPFEQEPGDRPGHTITGGPSDLDPILAEHVNDEVARIDSNLAGINAALGDLEDLLDVAEVVSGTQSTLELTVPAGETAVRIVGVFRSDSASQRVNLNCGINNESSTNRYRMTRLAFNGDSAAGAMVFDVRDSNWHLGAIAPGGGSTSSEFGSVDILFPKVAAGGRRRIQSMGGQLGTVTAAEASLVFLQGRSVGTDAISTIQLSFNSGSFVAGSRFELRRA